MESVSFSTPGMSNMPNSLEVNQISAPSSATLNGYEEVQNERHIEESVNRARNAREGNDCAENDPTQHVERRRMIKKTFGGPKSSVYRGVTKCNANRFEAFVWDNTIPSERGRTVYIGGFATEIEAARAHDLVAIKIWGESTTTNFPVNCYEKEIKEMKSVSKEEYILSIRRTGKGLSKGERESPYRGVYKTTISRKWQARLGKGKGMRSVYLGTFYSPEDAAKAYDVASIRLKGKGSATNFDMSSYDVKNISECARLPVGMGASKSLKTQTVDDVILQRGIYEAYPPKAKAPESKSSGFLHQHSHHQLLDQHLFTSSSFHGYQNPNLIQSSPYILGWTGIGAEVGINGNPIDNYRAMFPNQGASIEQSVLPGNGLRESQAQQALQNQVNVNDEFHQNLFNNQFLHQRPNLPLLHGDQDLGFQNYLSFPDWSSGFETQFEGNTEPFSNAFNGGSPMYHMVNGSSGAESGVSSFGLHSTGIHTVEPYNQEFEAAQLELPVLDQSCEPYQYHPNNLNQNSHENSNSCFPNSFQNPCSETNTGSRGQMTESPDDDFDISQFLNSSYMEETDWTDDFDGFGGSN